MASSTARNLRPVGADEEPAPRVSISDSLTGSARDVLTAMRAALAQKIDAGELASNAIASSYRALRELDREIRALDEEEEFGLEALRRIPDEPFDPSMI